MGILARRCFPSEPVLLSRAFEHLVANAATLSYVILDLRPRLSETLLRIRHSFRVDEPVVTYLSEADGRLNVLRKRRKTARPPRPPALSPERGPNPPTARAHLPTPHSLPSEEVGAGNA